MPEPAPPERPRSLLEVILYGLPQSLASWIRTRRSRRTVLGAGILTFIGFVLGGIVGNASYAAWLQEVQPWFNTRHTNWVVTNRLLFGTFLGWGIALVFMVLVFVLGVAGGRLLGRIDSAERDKMSLERTAGDLRQEVGELRAKNSLLTEQLNSVGPQAAELVEYRKLYDREKKLRELILQTDDELFLLLEGNLGEQQQRRFVCGVLRRMIELFDNCAVRGSVYIPDPNQPDTLIIMWDVGVGQASRDVNRWYIGDLEPEVVGKARGIPGAVWKKGKGRVNAHVREDKDFKDPYVPPRTVLPYESTLHVPICPPDEDRKLGVLVLDSREYTFQDEDLAPISRAATRLGRFLQIRHGRTQGALDGGEIK